MLKFNLLLCFLFSSLLAGNKKEMLEASNLVAQAKVALDAKNYELASEIYSKLPNKGLKLAKMQALFDQKGDYARALVIAHRRLSGAPFSKRLEIMKQIELLQTKLGLYKQTVFLPAFVSKRFKNTKKIEQVIKILQDYKNAITTFGLEFLVLALWILFLFCMFVCYGFWLKPITFGLFLIFGHQLYERLILDNPRIMAFVVQPETKLMTKPDFDDATVLSSLKLGERIDVLESRGSGLRVFVGDGEVGWVAASSVERVK